MQEKSDRHWTDRQGLFDVNVTYVLNVKTTTDITKDIFFWDEDAKDYFDWKFWKTAVNC